MWDSLALLRDNRHFGWFLFSRGLYALADSSLPALLAVSVVTQGGRVSDLAWVLGVGAVPAVAGSLFTPGLLRHVTQKTLFQWTCLAWGVITLIVGILDLFHMVSLWVFIAVSFLLELVASTLYPAIGSYLPQIVEEKDLKRANSQRAVVVGAVGVAGPALASALAVFGSRWLAWACLAALMGAAFLAQTGLAPGAKAPGGEQGIVQNLSIGWRFFRASPGLVAIVLYSGLWHLLAWSAYMVAGPWVLEANYGALWSWGVLESLFAVGLILGGLLAERVRGATQVVCVGSLLPILVLLLALAWHWPLWSLFGIAGISGAALTVAGVHWATRVQAETPEEMIAATFSFDYLLSEGLAPLGYLVMPMMFAMVSVDLALIAVAALCLVVGVAVIWFFPKRFVAERVE